MSSSESSIRGANRKTPRVSAISKDMDRPFRTVAADSAATAPSYAGHRGAGTRSAARPRFDWVYPYSYSAMRLNWPISTSTRE